MEWTRIPRTRGRCLVENIRNPQVQRNTIIETVQLNVDI